MKIEYNVSFLSMMLIYPQKNERIDVMKVKLAFTLCAIAWVLFGLPFVFFPSFAMSLFNIYLDVWGYFMVRLFGAALIGFAVISWTLKDDPPSEARRHVILGETVHSAIATIVFIYGAILGFESFLSFIPLVIHLIFAVWFGYLYLKGAK
jgi:hypothetical protein